MEQSLRAQHTSSLKRSTQAASQHHHHLHSHKVLASSLQKCGGDVPAGQKAFSGHQTTWNANSCCSQSGLRVVSEVFHPVGIKLGDYDSRGRRSATRNLARRALVDRITTFRNAATECLQVVWRTSQTFVQQVNCTPRRGGRSALGRANPL